MAMPWHRKGRAKTFTGQKHPACSGSNRFPGGVAALARCKGPALRTATARKPICTRQIDFYLSRLALVLAKPPLNMDAGRNAKGVPP